MYESDNVAVSTVTTLFIIPSIIGNSLVCAVILRNRDMRIPINYLLVNLAVADIAYATFYIPKIISNHTATHPKGLFGRILCALLTDASLAWVGGASSIFTLVAVATERYYSVIYPHGNKGKLTRRKLKMIISGSWISAFILNSPEFVKQVENNNCSYVWLAEWMPKAFTLTWRVFCGLSFALMLGLYFKVVHTLWFKGKADSELTYQQKGVLKVRKRVTLMVVTVSVVFGICWGTDSVMHVIDDFSSFRLNSYAIPVAHTMIMFNSAVNPFAYALINQRFRKKMKAMLCCSSLIAKTYPEMEPQGIELAARTGHVIGTGGRTSFVEMSMLRENNETLSWPTTSTSQSKTEVQIPQSNATENNS